MFKCERCGSGYSASHIGVENCPRCMLVDRVQAPLTFKVFELHERRTQMAPLSQPSPRQPVRSAP